MARAPGFHARRGRDAAGHLCAGQGLVRDASRLRLGTSWSRPGRGGVRAPRPDRAVLGPADGSRLAAPHVRRNRLEPAGRKGDGAGACSRPSPSGSGRSNVRLRAVVARKRRKTARICQPVWPSGLHFPGQPDGPTTRPLVRDHPASKAPADPRRCLCRPARSGVCRLAPVGALGRSRQPRARRGRHRHRVGERGRQRARRPRGRTPLHVARRCAHPAHPSPRGRPGQGRRCADRPRRVVGRARRREARRRRRAQEQRAGPAAHRATALAHRLRQPRARRGTACSSSRFARSSPATGNSRPRA